MRKLIAFFSLCLILTHSAWAEAQSPTWQRVSRANTARRRANIQRSLLPRTARPQQIIFQRASYRAQQRVARIESRKAMGHSLMRPLVRGGGRNHSHIADPWMYSNWPGWGRTFPIAY